MNISKYEHYIDLECSNFENNILNIKAIKIDGKESLKEEISCSDFKSCDYLLDRDDKIQLIEISDFHTQLEKLKLQYQSLKLCKDTDKKVLKRNHPMSIIKKEIRDKYIQTLLILQELVKYIDFNISKAKEYILAFCIDNISDIMIFENIKNELLSSLKGHIEEVKLIPAMELEKVLKL